MNKKKIAEDVVSDKYVAHEAAGVFPLLKGAALKELADDIKTHGLLEPIVLWQKQILDGRNRYAACKMVGVEPQFRHLKECPSPMDYVFSTNLKRRHLTPGQRARLAAYAKPIYKAEAAARQKAGGQEGGKIAGKGRPKASAPKGPKPNADAGKATRQAAKAAGVGHRQLEAMEKIEKEAPEIAAKVGTGEIATVAEAQRQVEEKKTKELSEPEQAMVRFMTLFDALVKACREVTKLGCKLNEQIGSVEISGLEGRMALEEIVCSYEVLTGIVGKLDVGKRGSKS